MLERKRKAGVDKPPVFMRSSLNRLEKNPNAVTSQAKAKGKTAKEKQEKRAQSRQQRHGPQTQVTPANVHNMTVLESMNVSHTRRESYVQAWDSFKQFVRATRLSITSASQLDAAAVWWIDHMYFQGDNIASVMTFLAAVKHFRSDIQRLSDLSRAMRAFKGFKKIAPGQARVPLPYPMLALIALHILNTKQRLDVCIWLLLTWHLCARPGEAFKLQWKHMVAPNPINRFWSVVMSPSAEEEGAAMPSKVGETDESVTLNVTFLQWMNPLLLQLKSTASDNDFVCPFKQSVGSKLFLASVRALGFHDHGVQYTYQIRHGAASTEVLCRGKSLEDVMKKGRWKTLVSVRRYEQGGKLAQVFGSLSKKDQQRCLDAEAELAQQMFACVGCSKRPKVAFSWKSSPARGT